MLIGSSLYHIHIKSVSIHIHISYVYVYTSFSMPPLNFQKIDASNTTIHYRKLWL